MVQNSTTDYLRLAYLQALSIKATQQKHRLYAVVVDAATRAKITDEHLRVFDYVLDIPWEDEAAEDTWKLANEWKVWWATPFKETVKLDADVLFTSNIDHWWPIMQTRDVCLCTTIRDHRGDVVEMSPYRQQFRDNSLLEAYSAFSYFRYTRISADFFVWCYRIFHNWPMFRDRVLTRCQEEQPTTDTVYALAARMIGEENCYLPGVDVPSFAHMKGGIVGLGIEDSWNRYMYCQIDPAAQVSVGTYRQNYPLHYHVKDFATEELIERYRRIVEGSGRV